MEINQALEKLDSFESTKSGPKQSKSGTDAHGESDQKLGREPDSRKEEMVNNNLGSSDKQNVTVKRDPLRNFTPSK